ncbi:LOW QUALITY PROTEIN: hypothetical protein MC885_020848, partial [Smutsia gigantea]
MCVGKRPRARGILSSLFVPRPLGAAAPRLRPLVLPSALRRAPLSREGGGGPSAGLAKPRRGGGGSLAGTPAELGRAGRAGPHPELRVAELGPDDPTFGLSPRRLPDAAARCGAQECGRGSPQAGRSSRKYAFRSLNIGVRSECVLPRG